jgi:hypothetical protein
MRMIRMMVFSVAACAFLYGTILWGGSIYTWTDQNHVVHITETPPPPGVAADDVLYDPSESPATVPASSQRPRWEIRQAEQQARQASQQLQQAEKNAQQAKQKAEKTIQEARQYIDSHDNNQYMRLAFKYKL